MSAPPPHPEPHRLGLARAARDIARGTLRSLALVEACLERIEHRDADVRAWAHIDPDAARQAARRCDAEVPRGPLHGVPVGIKDIIDTADFPTERGSALFAGRRPGRDAECVARLREAGAILLGKTVTTEFAYFAPGPTANPHDPRHTPGGSSSGSAAAVADFQVPAALGTQTAGSVIRPASFNGVFGFKPTFGTFPIEGVLPLAPSLDTVGLFARFLDDVALLAGVLSGGPGEGEAGLERPRVAFLKTPYAPAMDEAAAAALEGFAASLAAKGLDVAELESPALEGLAEHQNALLALEAGETLGPLVAADPDKVRPETRALLELGAAVPAGFRDTLDAACAHARRFLEEGVFARADVILTAAAPGAAPEGLAATGDPLFNRIWTLLGLPCLSLPFARGARGLPLGAQLVGARGADAQLLRAARAITAVADYAIECP